MDVTPDPVAPHVDELGYIRASTGGHRRTADDIEETMRVAGELEVAGPRKWIFDGTGFTAAEPAAWSTMIRNIESVADAVAVVVAPENDSLVRRYQEALNAFLLPCRLFTSDDAAIEWLESLDL